MKNNLLLIIALILNLIIICSVCKVFKKLKDKKEIFKYYTYVQSLLALAVSTIFVFYFILGEIPSYVRGLRYIVTCGLIFTMIIYNLFLSRNKNNLMRDSDYLDGYKANTVNFLLHQFCPIISLISFIYFEKDIIVDNGIWTILVIVPSVLYCLIYFILSITKGYKLPYDFSNKKNNKFIDKIIFILIPLLFILVTYIIWNIK